MCANDPGACGGQAKAAAVKGAIKTAYNSTAEAVVAACNTNGWKDGACTIALLVIDAMVYVINVGDSKVRDSGPQ